MRDSVPHRFLQNPYWNPKARATITGLDPGTDLYRIYKGILEGIACGVYTSAGAAVKKLVKVDSTISPDREIFSAYSVQVAKYNRIARKGG